MPVIRIFLVLLGTVSLVLGIIGAFLPLLPTTPFLLLTAFLYGNSSPRCYNWLLRQPIVGKYIRNFRENKTIPLQAKILLLLLMWSSTTYCVVCLLENWPVMILLVLISSGVTIHILSFKSK